MRIVQITTDSRVHFQQYDREEPYFGTAPAGLLDGFDGMSGTEIHLISCSPVKMAAPDKLADNIWFHQPYVSRLGWGRTLFAGCVLATRNVLNDIKPDIVHGQGTERNCALSAVHSGYPNVLTLHGNMRVHASRPENQDNMYYKLAAFLEGYCLKRTSGVVAISRYTENLVKDMTPRTWLLPNAVDARFFDVMPAPQATPRILFVGSIDERKNPIGLLQACEPMLRSGGCTLTFAGQANTESAYVREFFRKADAIPGIELTGFIGRDELTSHFRRSSLLVLPTFEDNCPMVVLEAMAAGLPVAASRVGGIPDLITHESDGLMFDLCHPTEMQTCIEKLASDPELRERLGNAARMTARTRFHPKIIAAGHMEIYREVLGRA